MPAPRGLLDHEPGLRPRLHGSSQQRVDLYHCAYPGAHSRTGNAPRSGRHRRSGPRLGVGDGFEVYFCRRREASFQSGSVRCFAAGPAPRHTGDVVGRRQSAAPAGCADRRSAGDPQDPSFRSRSDVHARQHCHGSGDHRSRPLRPCADRDLPVIAAPVLRVRHVDRAADGADDPLAALAFCRARRVSSSRRTSMSGASTSHRRWRSSSATSLPMC